MVLGTVNGGSHYALRSSPGDILTTTTVVIASRAARDPRHSEVGGPGGAGNMAGLSERAADKRPPLGPPSCFARAPAAK